ncbi:hypothetical protein MmiHf6_07310 [Methanimicrococcus hongohii]|uniref:Uncharacterized protein n=1 Tax=Methanimicrococcus hongohii TaxID=3028295 RepID=A0AA96UZ78_9EURY|nr:hypothetical protein [Methanimicrococcus sp. Hf6]WNY23424.1 hypothetical protein MmiHf6_07310 [Methanimicrococcus sp. Hf6]
MVKLNIDKKTITIISILVFVIFAGCLTPAQLTEDDKYGTVSYEGAIYPIGNTNTVTFKTLDDNTYYPFFKNSIDKTNGYYFVNGKGQVFENLENDYENHPIELTPIDLEIGAFNWGKWFSDMGKF